MSSRPAAGACNWPLLYLALALTACATLLFQLSFTRILSVVFHDDFAATTMSLAMSGLAVGGLLSTLVKRTGSFYQKLGVIGLATAGLVLVALVFVLTTGAVIGELHPLIICLVTALPFTGAGMIAALVISETVERIENVYAFTLLGGAAAWVLVLALLKGFGGPNTVIAVAVLFSSTAAIWFSLGGSRLFRVLSVAAGLVLTMAVIANTGFRVFDVSYAKGRRLPAEQFVKWNGFSRVSLAGNTVYVNGDKSFDLEKDESDAAPCAVPPDRKVVFIGARGGSEIAHALRCGHIDVTVVEPNPIIANTILRQRFSKLSGDLYLRPQVHVVGEFLRPRGEFGVRSSAAAGVYAVPVTVHGRRTIAAIGVVVALFLFAQFKPGPRRDMLLFFLLFGTANVMLVAALVRHFILFPGNPVTTVTGLMVLIFTAGAAGSVSRIRRWRFAAVPMPAVIALTLLTLAFAAASGNYPILASLLGAPSAFLSGAAIPAALRIGGGDVRSQWSMNMLGCVAGIGCAVTPTLSVAVGLFAIAAVVLAISRAGRSSVAAS